MDARALCILPIAIEDFMKMLHTTDDDDDNDNDEQKNMPEWIKRVI